MADEREDDTARDRKILMHSDAERVPWIYIDDLDQAYRTRALYGTVKQAGENGSPLVGGKVPTSELEWRRLPFFGATVKPRMVTVVNLESGRRLTVVVYSTDAPLWIGTATTIEMQDYEPIPSDPHHVNPIRRPYHVRGRTNERYHGRRRRKAVPVAPVPVATDVFDSTVEAMFADAWIRTTKIELVAQHPILGTASTSRTCRRRRRLKLTGTITIPIRRASSETASATAI